MSVIIFMLQSIILCSSSLCHSLVRSEQLEAESVTLKA